MGSTPTKGTKLGRKALRAYKKGRAGMQPPIARIHPGSTPGRPIQSWAFGRTVMLLTLNQADTGSTPVAPTKFCPCNPSGRGAKLKIWKLHPSNPVRGIGEYAGMEQRWLVGLHNLSIGRFNSCPRHQN